jgi:hypothetical protein
MNRFFLNYLLGVMVIFSILSPFAPQVLSDVSSYYGGDGFTVYPVESKNIVLKEEVVRIRPDLGRKTSWLADCEFIFYSKSDSPETVTMGYPDWLDTSFNPDYVHLDKKAKELFKRYKASDPKTKTIEGKYGPGADIEIYFRGYQRAKLPYLQDAWVLRDLAVKVDSLKVSPSHRPTGLPLKAKKKYSKEFAFDARKPQAAYIWRVEFNPGETKIVKVSFNFSGLTELTWYQEVSYLLTSGALWADSIGVANIYWSLEGRKLKLKSIYPSGYAKDGNVIHWCFENFEPREDIGLFISYEDDK